MTFPTTERSRTARKGQGPAVRRHQRAQGPGSGDCGNGVTVADLAAATAQPVPKRFFCCKKFQKFKHKGAYVMLLHFDGSCQCM